MYIVSKEAGNNANITLINQDTKASVIIGRMTMEILSILEEAGHSFDKGDLKLKWEFEVSDEVGKKLASKAFVMEKPVRDQSKKSEQKISNKTIDAMDVLLGLANYN